MWCYYGGGVGGANDGARGDKREGRDSSGRVVRGYSSGCGVGGGNDIAGDPSSAGRDLGTTPPPVHSAAAAPAVNGVSASCAGALRSGRGQDSRRGGLHRKRFVTQRAQRPTRLDHRYACCGHGHGRRHNGLVLPRPRHAVCCHMACTHGRRMDDNKHAAVAMLRMWWHVDHDHVHNVHNVHVHYVL
jgi:hypothetical protein